MFEKYQARAIKLQIGQILWTVWDPTGVNQDPNARDEYQGYVGGVYELLVSGVSDEQLAKHLLSVVRERMELPARLEDMKPAVVALRRISLP